MIKKNLDKLQKKQKIKKIRIKITDRKLWIN